MLIWDMIGFHKLFLDKRNKDISYDIFLSETSMSKGPFTQSFW